ncbi:MAG: hypothetical protein WCV90_00920 [Candidatus Woesearchaeota archaeon]|jgi:hypothetical protein
MAAPEQTTWYFLSFRDPVANKNLGCCNVAVIGGLEKALRKTHDLGINPGGEVMAYPMDEAELDPDRLYSRQEMIQLGYRF